MLANVGSSEVRSVRIDFLTSGASQSPAGIPQTLKTGEVACHRGGTHIGVVIEPERRAASTPNLSSKNRHLARFLLNQLGKYRRMKETTHVAEC